jgi:hypothetical protein
MPLKTLRRKLWEKTPERLKRKIPDPIRWRVDPEFDPEDPPVSTDPGSGFAEGPQMQPSEVMPLPESAAHPAELTQVQYNVGDPIEVDADPRMQTEATHADAVHVGGPPMQPPRPRPRPEPKDGEDPGKYEARVERWERREQAKRDRWEEQKATNPYFPYRQLNPGDARLRGGAAGTVRGVGRTTIMVGIAPMDVELNEGAFLPVELKALERGFDRGGMWVFGVLKEQIVPMKLEEERVWAHKQPIVVSVHDLVVGSSRDASNEATKSAQAAGRASSAVRPGRSPPARSRRVQPSNLSPAEERSTEGAT